jgi:hypothetical protein
VSGSSLAPVVIPIVVIPALAIWLIMVCYADSHPSWRGRAQLPDHHDLTQLPGEIPAAPMAASSSPREPAAVTGTGKTPMHPAVSAPNPEASLAGWRNRT